MALDIDQLMTDMTTAATQVLGSDVTTLRGFSDRQMKAIAQQAAFIEAGIISGQITDETKEFFLDSLENMVLSFVQTLRGLLTATIEKVWNTIVLVIWKAIATVAGITLPTPSHA